MSARINWATPQAYSSTGAPTNGADYVAVPGGDGQYTFDGAEGYPAPPVQWTKAADGRLYSGTGNNLDRAIARQITRAGRQPDGDGRPGVPDRARVGLRLRAGLRPTRPKKWVSLEQRQHDEHRRPARDRCGAGEPARLHRQLRRCHDAVVRPFQVRRVRTSSSRSATSRTARSNEPGVWLSGMSVGGTPVADATDLSAWTSLTGAVPVPVDELDRPARRLERHAGLGRDAAARCGQHVER